LRRLPGDGTFFNMLAHARARKRNMEHRSRLRPLRVSGEERVELRQLTRRARSAPALAVRARIVLACEAEHTNRAIARRLGVTSQTVGKWRNRFAVRRVHGLYDEPRSGAPRSISDALVEAVVAKTLHGGPPGGPRWSSRRLASTFGISQRAVLRIWRDFGV
jgi:transposase